MAGCAADSKDEGAPEPHAPLASTCGNPEPGTVPQPLRRLTRFEYARTIEDLTGVPAAIADALPPDEESLGFLNIADAYSVSTLHATKYLEIAEQVADALVDDPERLATFAGCDPTDDLACVEPFIREFGRRAFRRALDADELTAMRALFEQLADPGLRDGVRAVVATMLQAPQFLYRIELPGVEDPEPEHQASVKLDAYALATRLAYLLTASAPDAELLAAAESGALETPSGVQAEVERLLETPRALEAFGHFVSQWWELGSLATLEKDRRIYRDWRATLPALFAEEQRQFLAHAWAGSLSLETLLRAPYTFVNAELASFYGLPLPKGPGFQRVELDPTRASGMLTQGALLATHAKANQTSPIHRGKWVRARLFCVTPPPPPNDIVVRPPAVNPRLSTRERFAQHTEEPACAGCHQLMDPIGFGFEHYDATGRYREMDGGKPVDASGELTFTDVDGPFDGVPELAERLLESAQVRACVATQWFRYAFGRSERTEADRCAIAELSAGLAERGGDLRAMIRATTRQPLFHAPPTLEVEP